MRHKTTINNMKKFVWDKLINLLRKFNKPLQIQLINFSYLAKHMGQYNSLKQEKPVDSFNNPLPWITYPCIEYLNQFDFSSEIVFEYGSGGSTKWFLNKNSREVVSVENDINWFNVLLEDQKKFKNLTPIFANTVNDFIDNNKVFDASIVFIDCDSSYRLKILQNLYTNINKINSKIKCIIIDDVDKKNLKGGDIDKIVFDLAKKLNWVQIDFMGFRPFNRTYASTTVLVNPNKQLVRDFEIKPLSAFSQF